MAKDFNHRPFAMPVVKHANITSAATNFMITRAPWPAPSYKYYVIHKLVATNLGNASGGMLTIWDQDLSNTSPVARGSSTSPLIAVPIPMFLSGQVQGNQGTGAMINLDQDAMPMEYFQAGITCQVTGGTAGVVISLELEVV